MAPAGPATPGTARRALRKRDQRILGEADFVEAILAQAQARYSRHTAGTRRGGTVERRVGQVAEVCQVDPQDVVAQGRPAHQCASGNRRREEAA